jgi:hypothetical protein
MTWRVITLSSHYSVGSSFLTYKETFSRSGTMPSEKTDISCRIEHKYWKDPRPWNPPSNASLEERYVVTSDNGTDLRTCMQSFALDQTLEPEGGLDSRHCEAQAVHSRFFIQRNRVDRTYRFVGCRVDGRPQSRDLGSDGKPAGRHPRGLANPRGPGLAPVRDHVDGGRSIFRSCKTASRAGRSFFWPEWEHLGPS